MKLLKIVICIISVILLIATGIFLYTKNTKNEQTEFKLDSDNKYQIITDMKYITMRNDGGSHTDVSYQVDLDSNTITKIEVEYKANIGGKPESEKNIIYTKEIDSNMKKQVKSLIDEIIKKKILKKKENITFMKL